MNYEIPIDPARRKARGAASNRSGRYDLAREAAHDGWADPEALPAIRTEVRDEVVRSAITYNRSPDLPFDRSVNPYRGCEHGCVYCYARPSHAYWGYSPGLDFESVIFKKPEAAKLLVRTFMDRNYRPDPVVFGANTDCYQPVERKEEITREILKVCAEFYHPVSVITKSALILRDLDIIAPLAKKGLFRAAISITTLDRKLARDMEPRAATPSRRLETVRALSEAGIPVTVMAAPMIPALNDRELEAILQAAAEAGAISAGYVLLRLPMEIKGLFREWLATTRPDSASHVMSLIRQTHGGAEYVSAFGKRQRGDGPYARLLASRFRRAIERYGLKTRGPGLRCDLFERPLSRGNQPSLF